MKKLGLLLSIMFWLLLIPVMKVEAAEIVDSGECGDNVTWTLDDEGTLVISGEGPMWDYANNFASDDERAPFYKLEIKKVIIEDGVTSVGDYSFDKCTSLEEISISSSVTSIGIRALALCDNLEEINIPSSVTNIKSHAFWMSANLKKVNIPPNITSIANGTFLGCEDLEKIVIPIGVTSIGNGAFAGCARLKEIILPEGISVVSEGMVANCKQLEKIIIPSNVTSIEYDAFAGCTSLEEIIIPSSVREIGNSAFRYCSSLKSIEIPYGVEKIGEQVFSNCTSLVRVEIPSSVTSIDFAAFARCASLTEIELPYGITSIGHSTFSYCTSLKEIVLPNSIENIGKSAFSECTGLTKVELPSKLVSLEQGVFCGCTGIDAIQIPASVKSIGNEVFNSCSSLSKIIFLGDAPSLSSESFVGLKGPKIYYGEDKNWDFFVCLGYGGDVAWFPVPYIADYTYDISNELWYPIKDMEALEKQLELWMQESDYEQTFETWMKEYTYEDILNMSINLPLKAEDEEFYLLESSSTVKDVMGCILFADVAQNYIDNIECITERSLNSESNSERINGYNTFLSKVKNFHYRYINFKEDWWNGNDIFNETLQGLMLARTAIAVADDLENKLDTKVSYKYVTDMYKITADLQGENPNYYDEIKYYLLSGGDTSYLSKEYKEPLKDYGMLIRDMKGIYKIAKGVTGDVVDGEGDYGTASDIISFGIDNLAYFAEKYDLPGSDVIKTTKKVWEHADGTIKYFDAMTTFSLPGIAKSALSLSEEYIKQVKAVYEAYEELDAAWYALMYYHLKQNNERLLDSIMNDDGSVGLRNGFSLEDFSDYAFGYDTLNSDPVEKSIVTYYRNGGYLGYSYSVGVDFRNYLLSACNNMIAIQSIDCEEYQDILLQCILAELNFQNGEVGISFEIDAYANDTSLGKVSGTGEYMAESAVTLVAIPYENVSFVGWINPETGEMLSDSTEYQIEVCGDTSYEAEFVEGEVEVAKKPVINMQPKAAFYSAGEGAEKMSVSATSTDGGEISISWYVNTTDTNTGGRYIGSGTGIYPDTTLSGTYYYYAVVTNIKTDMVGTNEVETTAMVNSQVAKIEIGNVVQISMEVTQLPDLLEYFVGEELIMDGMEVMAYYSDGSNRPLTEYEVEYDFSIAGETIVEVKHLNYVDEFTVMVKERQELKFASASLTLYDNVSIKFKVKQSLLEESGYQNPYVVFRHEGKEYTVTEFTISNERCVFEFKDIAPNWMNDTVTATLYAELDGEIYEGETRDYSVAEYCYYMLENYEDDSYTSLRTLLVDLLNYGAASQKYANYKTDALANAALTAEQAAWGTASEPELKNVLNKAYETVENPTVFWKGAGLRLEESVVIRYKFAAEDIDNLSIKIVSESGKTWVIPAEKFVATEGGYYAYFDGLYAMQMSEPVYATVYKDSVPVSDTLCYSVESYAYAMHSSADETLNELLSALMKYGNAAYEYAK